MAEFPTTIAHTKLKGLFSKIRSLGVPSAADPKWLESAGFTTTNERGLLSVLKFLGFIDGRYVPTDRWRSYRTQKDEKLPGTILKEAYRDLYEHTPNAHNAPKADLEHFFRARTEKDGEVTIKRQVTNFQCLAAMSLFVDDPTEAAEALPPETAPNGNESVSMPTANVCQLTTANGLTINLNVQITLPESVNSELVDQLFLSMGKHLLQKS